MCVFISVCCLPRCVLKTFILQFKNLFRLCLELLYHLLCYSVFSYSHYLFVCFYFFFFTFSLISHLHTSVWKSLRHPLRLPSPASAPCIQVAHVLSNVLSRKILNAYCSQLVMSNQISVHIVLYCVHGRHLIQEPLLKRELHKNKEYLLYCINCSEQTTNTQFTELSWVGEKKLLWVFLLSVKSAFAT